MENKSIEIRDLRNHDWIWTSKKLLFHEQIDGNSYKVYGGLAAYANNTTQQAFPSIETLAAKLHMSRNTVIRALSNLLDHGFINAEKKQGEHNIYILLSGPEAGEKKPELPEAPKQLPAVAPKTNIREIFEKVWAIYPNHANKKTAEKKFLKLKKETIITIVTDIKKRKVEHDQWIKGIIPHFSTYINQERWNDPIVKATGEKRETAPAIHPELRKRLFKANNEERYRDAEDAPVGVKSMAELLKAK